MQSILILLLFHDFANKSRNLTLSLNQKRIEDFVAGSFFKTSGMLLFEDALKTGTLFV